MPAKSFKGNLEILNLSDIFQSLAMNRHSGTLIVNDGKREKKIFFAEGEICLLSSLITLTPGTLTIDVAPDRLSLSVHFMHVDDEESAVRSIQNGFERRVLEVTR